jgi:hypothetical protein
MIWGIIRCRHLENKLKTHDECFPQPHTHENNGMKFGVVTYGMDFHGSNFTRRIPNLQMEFLQHL